LNRDTSHYPEREGTHPDRQKWHAGHILLEVFRERARGTEEGDGDPVRGRLSREDLSRRCRQLKAVVESAIRSFSNRCNGEGTNAFLTPLIMMNDLEFLDKRTPLDQDLEASLGYYRGLQRDLDALIGLMRENRVD